MSRTSRTQLIEAIVDSFTTMARSSGAAGPEPWLDLDLTLPQMKVLMLLDSVSAARPSEIAEATGATATGVTGIIDRLAERSLVRREPDTQDRRALIVRLEPGGEAVLDAIHTAGRSHLTDLLSRVDDDDLSSLRTGMAALIEQLIARQDERPAPRHPQPDAADPAVRPAR